ncbi:hypothetical protein [Sessilibacter corallicola]|uniref:DUF4760 domain-containing protein n=1 Tax=Sessilibacter corallicola TaxID=2904075 RepID=A0ABQ0A7C6_9GAMM
MDSSKIIKCLIELAPVISAFMPLFVIFLTGLWASKRLEKIKSRLQIDHTIIKKRAEIYSEIQDDLNDLYSYILRVGKWKELTPPDILEKKRNIDQKLYSTNPYWSQCTMKNYEKFIKICFKTYRGHGKDAGIRAEIEKYKGLANWEPRFNESFVDGYDEAELKKANKNFMESLSKDFGIV